MQMLPLTVRSQKQHFQLISSSEDWRTVRVSHVKIAKLLGGLNCELSTVLWPISNLSSLFLSAVVKRCPASSQNTGATIKPHLSGAGTLGSRDNPKKYYWLNQFYRLPFLYFSNCSMFFKDIGISSSYSINFRITRFFLFLFFFNFFGVGGLLDRNENTNLWQTFCQNELEWVKQKNSRSNTAVIQCN